MRDPTAPAMPPRSALRAAFAAGALALGACDQRPALVRNCSADAAVPCPGLNDPAGRIEGTILYEGPPPPPSPRRAGEPSGRIVLLLFDANNPPPPEGTATSAVSFQTLPAAELFEGAALLPDGNVRAAVRFTFPGILRGGEYQLRAFYSRNEVVSRVAADGTTILSGVSGFHPLYSVRNQPVRGDVGGGALVDPAAPTPRFARIVVGERSGANTGAPYVIPERGVVVPNVQVHLRGAYQYPTERPVFRVVTSAETVATPAGPVMLAPPNRLAVEPVGAPPGASSSGAAPAPSDALLAYARDTGLLPPGATLLRMPRNPVVARPDGSDLPALTVAASMPPSDCDVAAVAGVACAEDPLRQIGFFELALDRNANGTIDLTAGAQWADAHPTLVTSNPAAMATDGRLPWLFPLVVLTKLHEPTAAEAQLLRSGQNGTLPPDQYERLRTALNRPERLDLSDPNDRRYPTVIFGSVIPGGAPENFLLLPWTRGHRQVEPFPQLAIIPVAVEVRGPDPAADWHAVIPPSPAASVAARARFLPTNYRCVAYDPAAPPDDPARQAGVPPGRYALNLVSSTGQTWAVPNELAAFPAPMGATPCAGGVCRADSQAIVVRVSGVEPPPDGVMAVCPDPPVRGGAP